MLTGPSRDEKPSPQEVEQPQDPDQAVLAAVVDSFYPELVQSGRLAKERAQQMLSAVTVLSAALIAALVAGGANVASPAAKLAAIVAVVAWVIASVVLAWAASPRKGEDFPADMPASELVRWVINDSTTMEREVESRLRRAIGATVTALVITLGSFGMYLFLGNTEEWRRSEVTFAQNVGAPPMCGPGGSSAILVDSTTVSRDMIRLMVTCADGSHGEWLVSRDAIVALRVY